MVCMFARRPRFPVPRRSAAPWGAALLAALAGAGCSRPPATAPVVAPASAPAPEEERPPAGPPWFVDVTAAAGVDFVHRSGDSADKPFPSANGSGLAAIDFDLDGRHDLCLPTGVPFPVDARAEPHGNRLFRNRGRLRFDDVTRAAGLAHGGYVHGAAVGDFDSDGFPDLFLSGYGADVLFHNRGDGTFVALGADAGLADGGWSSSAAFLDADGDGLLDLYVCRYGVWSEETARFCGDRESGRRVFCSPLTVEPQPDVLRRNAGDGTFVDATGASGLAGRPGRALAVIAAHLDGDAAIDLYVANDMNPNSLWRGGADGRFSDSSDLSGTAYDHEGRVKSSMGIDVADTGHRGASDMMVTDFEGEASLFFTGSEDGIFRDASESSGAGGPSLPFVSWGIQFSDFDLDGWDDVVIANGHVGDDRHRTGDAVELRQHALLLRNEGGRFVAPPRGELGPYFVERHQGRGVIAVDLDNDDDQDLVFNHRDEPAAVLRNDRGRPGSGRPCVVLRLVGTAGNRDCVGAVAVLDSPAGRVLEQVTGGGGYQSSGDRRVVFALPDGVEEPSISVRWPGGRTTTLAGISAGRWLVVEPTADAAAPRVTREEARP